MSDKLNEYVDGVFAPYEGTEERGRAEGRTCSPTCRSDIASCGPKARRGDGVRVTVESIGDIEETVREVSNLSASLNGRWSRGSTRAR
jgi:hypothetical protein